MSRRHLSAALAAVLAAGLITGGASASPESRRPVVGEPRTEHGCARIEKELPELADWPRVDSRVKSKPADERRVRDLLAGMTLAEKVGQMTQPEIGAITPDEVREYGIGSVLNGGGSWPNRDKHAAPEAWLALADAYWDASKTSRTGIPAIWGIDAVHGNNNVYGATVFPHNIGVGGGATDGNTPTEGLVPGARSGTGAASPNFAVNMPAAVGTDVAERAGVSQSTVSLVLSGASSLDPELAATFFENDAYKTRIRTAVGANQAAGSTWSGGTSSSVRRCTSRSSVGSCSSGPRTRGRTCWPTGPTTANGTT